MSVDGEFDEGYDPSESSVNLDDLDMLFGDLGDLDTIDTMSELGETENPVMGNDDQFNSPPPDHIQPPQSTQATNDLTTKLGKVLSQNVRNNFAWITHLSHFCGGAEHHPHVPNVRCATDALIWIRQIEEKTADPHWDAEGRIAVAIQFAVGEAHAFLTCLKSEHGNNWVRIKQDFLVPFPKKDGLQLQLGELGGARRRVGETVTSFYLRPCVLKSRIDTTGWTWRGHNLPLDL